ncbi:MAG: glycosyltransferase family 4 protein [Fimbriimonadaceae bacterium]|nr:glycosyltransferase family 4 protein [Fimbriimonadaceae bacterium]QYK57011.1 MAG: glycosyltransferase family 4 protein [Fimbriimonadaceae bacterium]
MKSKAELKVMLVGNYVPDKQYSMLGFYDCLIQNLPGFNVCVVASQPKPRFGLNPGKTAKWRGYVDKFILYPREQRSLAKRVDVVHICDQGNAMYLAHAGGKPSVLTCHDVLPIRAAMGQIEGWVVGPTGQKLQAWIKKSIPLATHIACASEATLEDLLGLNIVRDDQVSVLLNGFYRPLFDMTREAAKADLARLKIPADKPYILHVGGNSPYKNRVGFVSIARELSRRPGFESMRFLMAGHAFDEELQGHVHKLGMETCLFEVVRPTDETVAALYVCADALVFPSLQEGFGLPIIEAQAYGCPVFTSNKAPMTEVGGDACVYFDPLDPVRAAEYITGNWSERETLREKGSQNAKRFATERMVGDYVTLYGSLA